MPEKSGRDGQRDRRIARWLMVYGVPMQHKQANPMQLLFQVL